MATIVAPPIYGPMFSFVVNLLEFAPVGDIILPIFMKLSGFSILSNVITKHHPTYYPVPQRIEDDHLEDITNFENTNKKSVFEIQQEEIARISSEYEAHEKGDHVFYSVVDYHNMYKRQQVTPIDVALNILKNIKDVDNPNSIHGSLHIFLKVKEEVFLKEARESTERYKSGNPLSVFDGVPITIKDELDLANYTSHKG